MQQLRNHTPPSLFRVMRTTVRVIAHEYTYNVRQVVTDNVVLCARMGVLILLYSYVASVRGGTVGGVSVEVVAWTSFIYFIIFAYGLRWVARFIERDVKNGTIELYVRLPVNYIWQRLFSKFGSMATPVAGTIAGGLLLVCTLYGVPFFWNDVFLLGTLLWTLIGGFFLGFFVNMCIGLMAFWVEDIQPIQNVYEKAAMVLGGAYIPVALFPHWLQVIATYTPFGLAYAATRVVSPQWEHEWLYVCSAQCVWILLSGAMMWWMYQRSLVRVTIHGG